MGSSTLINEVPHSMVTFIFVVMVMLLHQPTLIYSFGTTTIGRSLPQQPSAVPSLRQYSPSRRKGLLLSPMGAAPTFSRTNAIKTMNMINAYGRGAEIWPECNEDAVQLADSFPNGHIPFSAIIDIERADMNMMHQRVEISIEEGEDVDGTLHTVRKKKVLGNNTTGRKRQYMKRILRRAAAKEEIDIEGEITPIDRTPIAIGLALVLRGLVRPKDILVAASLTAYITILGMVAQSTARDFADITGTAAPILPAIPPQGHVPTILLHPLGRRMEESRLYDTWLKLGVAVGMVGPVVLLMRYILTHNLDAARFCARPLFLLCCQVVTEAVCSRRIMTPLPLRIFIPIAYNTSRLAYLWSWATTTTTVLGPIGRFVGITNALYWAINLLAFLIPIATLRYMRAHFFGVEAQEVTTRIGLEETVGFIPNYNVKNSS